MTGKSLGTAWIQIKPTMKGMTSSIRSELADVGDAGGSEIGSKFSAGFAAKIGVISGITQQLFAKVTQTITNQISDAIVRADTLERFPKVMEQMGYSAEDATKTIQKLMKGVEQVPTPLNAVVSGTQRLVAVTKDVDKASDWIMAISNAMLSNGASATRASDAMEQFMQVVQRGKPMGQDWLTIMEVAPGVMEELAHYLGYASASMGGDMYTALQKGTLSIEDFMAALVNMDKNGTDSLEALSTVARTATGGIETAMTTMRQSVSNAIVSIIQQIGPENIVNAITGIKNALVGIVQTIGNVVKFIQTNWTILEPIFTMITSFLGTVIGIFMAQKVFNGLTSIFSLIMANPIVAVIGAIAFAIAELIIHWDEVKATVETVFGAIGEVIGNFATWVGGVFNGIWETITGIFSNIGQFFSNVWDNITRIFVNIGTYIGDAVSGAFKAVVNGILSFIENFINTPVNILNGFLDVINGAFGWLGVNLSHIDGVHLPRMYTGGIVQGIGTDTSDSNIYALSKGEYVIRAAAARDIGYENLERMNQTGEIAGGGQTNYFTINGYDKSPEELANIISRKIAFNQRGVIG